MTTEITGYNNKVITEPFKDTSVKVAVQGGFGFINQKNIKAALKVIYGNGKDIYPGNVVHLDASLYNHAWAKNIIKLEDKDVIVVPCEHIEFVERELVATEWVHKANKDFQDKIKQEMIGSWNDPISNDDRGDVISEVDENINSR